MSDSDDGIAERLGVTLDSLRVGIIALDGQGRVEFLNAEASRILDLSRRASAGKPLAESLGDRHPVVSILMETLETGRAVVTFDGALQSATIVLEARLLE